MYCRVRVLCIVCCICDRCFSKDGKGADWRGNSCSWRMGVDSAAAYQNIRVRLQMCWVLGGQSSGHLWKWRRGSSRGGYSRPGQTTPNHMCPGSVHSIGKPRATL
jgi:hypothetical protein